MRKGTKTIQTLGLINEANLRIGRMGNMVYRKINYISWKNEAKRVLLNNDDMRKKLKEVMATRVKAKTNTKRADFTEGTYKTEIYGDYAELYMLEDGKYVIYCNNVRDNKKNAEEKPKRVDRIFQAKFKELNGIGLESAYGFVDKTFKRCIPKQFIYINKRLCDKIIKCSSIDASSQYPSGCLGLLPDVHGDLYIEGYAKPNEEYPFAFYASGHVAIYGELDTHEWLANKMMPYLFRTNKSDDWPFRPLTKDKEHTILMKASHYSMESTWRYFYDIKQSYPKDSKEYEEAKLVMNQVIGDWHRKDKDKKRIMSYDDGGSFQLAHIVAVAIARGNQKILNKIEEIRYNAIAHICVDGIVYLGDGIYGQEKTELGKFSQEYVNADFMMRDVNVYCARQNGKCIKFRHAGYDLFDEEEIDESRNYEFEDMYKLGRKERIGDIIKNG